MKRDENPGDRQSQHITIQWLMVWSITLHLQLVSKSCVQAATSATSLPNPALFLDNSVFHKFRCKWKSSMSWKYQSNTVWDDASCMDWALADWSMIDKEGFNSASVWRVLTYCQLSSYVGTLWPSCSKLRTSEWPGLLSIKLDFWCQGCTLFHVKAAVLEDRGQGSKCIF